MKRDHSPYLKGTLALAVFLSTVTADAGFSSRRLGITNVAVGGESTLAAERDAQPRWRRGVVADIPGEAGRGAAVRSENHRAR